VPRSLTALLALLALLVAPGCGDDDSGSGDKGSDAATAAQKAGGGGSSTTDEPAPTKCLDVKAPKPKPDGGQQRPKQKLDPARTYDVTFRTSCGDFVVRLDVKGAPNTAASFASLVRKGFYDGTVFHRIVPGFVIQGGDPTAAGSGGPGYSTVDRPPANARYTRGVVSMAKTATEPPGTSGSQFYVVSGADAGLPPDYAIVGKVVEGLDTVARIDRLGDPNSGSTGVPLRPVVVDRATLSSS
jgi:cyclophilin family peptidyl-prolyl cis-trans isomerase